jgi:hypothetical protein
MEAKKKWYLPPAFSVEFAAYFHDRTTRIEEQRRALEEQLKMQTKLRQREAEQRPRFDLATRQCEHAKETNNDIRQATQDLRDLLSHLRPSELLADCRSIDILIYRLNIHFCLFRQQSVTPDRSTPTNSTASGHSHSQH